VGERRGAESGQRQVITTPQRVGLNKAGISSLNEGHKIQVEMTNERWRIQLEVQLLKLVVKSKLR
jgi:hypothetical protein